MTTLLELRTRARIRADQDASTFPTDTQYNYFINESLVDVWWDLVSCGWPFRAATSSGTSASGGYTFTPARSLATIQSVSCYVNGAWTELPRLPEERRTELTNTTGVPCYYDASIDGLAGGTPWIGLYPSPSPNVSVQVRYLMVPVAMSADGDVWFGPARSDELVVLRAAMKGMRKEGNDQGAGQVQGEYAEVLDKVLRMASWFDQRNAGTIRDVSPLSVAKDPFDYDA
jgi:hypothetical protein